MSCNGLRKLTQLKYKYNNVLSKRVEFNLLRERQMYFESGDKVGKLLARDMKRRELAFTIPVVRSLTGVVLTATVVINKDFYRILH